MPGYAGETPTPVLCLSCVALSWWEGKMGEASLDGRLETGRQAPRRGEIALFSGH